MKEYYFLFVLAFFFTLTASIQDLKRREVANWLNFSFIAFALSYRAFYSIFVKDYRFFLLGFFGFAIFFILAHAFYYAKAFAGGDAKLLMAFGTILPYYSYKSLIILPIIFIFILFLVGAIYSLLYSIIIVSKNSVEFSKEFKKKIKKYKFVTAISTLLFLISLFLIPINPLILSFSILLLIPLVYTYTKSLEKCMVKPYSYNKLTEGDWLVHDIKLSSSLIIKKTIHGLSLEDIKLLKKYKKNVLIKEGIPFIPAFLITLIIMVFFFLTSRSLFLPFLS